MIARTITYGLLEAVRLTFVCWIVTSPVVAHHFQRVSLVAPLSNLLAAPLISAVVISGIGGLLLLPASPAAAELVIRFGALTADLVVGLSRWCASLPLAATSTPTPGAALTFALTGLALAMLLPGGGRRRALAIATASFCALLTGTALHDRFRADRLDVWFASVGQGDAAVVRMPGGRVWVIDEGPPGRGRMVVGPLLRRQWIGRVDVLVASHVQSDHSGALAEILDEFDVGEVWLPDGPCENSAARMILDDARKRGVPVRFVSSATRALDGGAAADAASTADGTVPINTAPGRGAAGAAGVEILWPPPGAAACNDNDQSLVIAFGFGGRRVLFTGDIEAPAEAAVAQGADLHADVLKVPHHGSRTSSTQGFLEAVRPAVAVASLGLDNHFRFPAPEVVARYSKLGTSLFRTDRDGAVHLTIGSDGSIGTQTFRTASAPGAASRR